MSSSLVLASRPCKPPSSSVARPTSRHTSVVRRGEPLLPPSPCSSFFPFRGPAMAPRRGSRLCVRPSPPDALPWRAARPGAACPRLPGVTPALRVARPPRPGVAWCARALLTARRARYSLGRPWRGAARPPALPRRDRPWCGAVRGLARRGPCARAPASPVRSGPYAAWNCPFAARPRDLLATSMA
jgi:hypothetical protein